MPSCADGAEPDSGLILDASGFLYGETRDGGKHRYGTVFMASVNGGESVLHSFLEGKSAYAGDGLLRDSKGNLYGTTSSAYIRNPKYFGVVFELKKKGFHYLHEFAVADPASGYGPNSPLVMDANGNLYSTAYSGGITNCLYENGCGLVFEITAAGSERVLYTFAGAPDGANPGGGVVVDEQGNLYGTTFYGGTGSNCEYPQFGCGTVFKIAPDGTETVLYSFKGEEDGGYPNGGLVLDSQGNLYGTTGNCGSSGCNYGAVFEVTPGGAETLLHSFAGGTDGAYPIGSLIMDGQGNLYGTTGQGGGSGCYGGEGCGTVFEVTPQGVETILYRFNGTPDGSNPAGGLVFDAQGNLYGATATGGVYGYGTVFVLPPGSEVVSIAINPANGEAGVGGTLQFEAFGTYSDGSSMDITSLVSWSSSNPSVATIQSGGLATGISVGTTTITASYEGIAGTAGLTVN
jgi:uncharacterized repeat protein (TIGR03803 family)